MSCVLRVYGKRFDVDKLTNRVPSFNPCIIYHKGERLIVLKRGDKKRSDVSGMTIEVSTKKAINPQFKDALSFLTRKRQAINRVTSFPGIDFIGLDFLVPLNPKKYLGKDVEIPNKLVKAMARARISLVLSFRLSSD